MVLVLLGTYCVFATDTNTEEHCQVRACDLKKSADCLQAQNEYWKCVKAENKLIETTMHVNLRNGNGIEVMVPQLYDNALLKQMLASAQARLSLLNVIDQGSVVSRLGAISGGSSITTSIAASVQGPPLPQMQSVQKAGSAAPDITTTQTPSQNTPPALAGSSIPFYQRFNYVRGCSE